MFVRLWQDRRAIPAGLMDSVDSTEFSCVKDALIEYRSVISTGFWPSRTSEVGHLADGDSWTPRGDSNVVLFAVVTSGASLCGVLDGSTVSNLEVPMSVQKDACLLPSSIFSYLWKPST